MRCIGVMDSSARYDGRVVSVDAALSEPYNFGDENTIIHDCPFK